MQLQVEKYRYKSEIYRTTKLTVVTASGKMKVAFCKLFFSETDSEKWKRSFTTYDLRPLVMKQTSPKLWVFSINIYITIWYIDFLILLRFGFRLLHENSKVVVRVIFLYSNKTLQIQLFFMDEIWHFVHWCLFSFLNQLHKCMSTENWIWVALILEK